MVKVCFLYLGRWISWRGPVEWAPRSPDLNPPECAFWVYVKLWLYSFKIASVAHLRQQAKDVQWTCCKKFKTNEDATANFINKAFPLWFQILKIPSVGKS